jgi:hypothetical protein
VSRHSASVLAWTLVGGSVVAALAGSGVLWAVEGSSSSDVPGLALLIAVFFVSATVGGLVASRLPANPIGWIFVGMVVTVGLGGAADGYVAYSLDRGDTGAFVPWAAEYSDDTFVAFFAMVFFSLLLFPNGHLLTRRWRAVLWTGIAGLLVCTAAIVFEPGTLDDYPELTNPAGVDSQVFEWLFLPGFLLFGVALAASAVSIVLRFRRARGVERQQLTVLMAAGVVGTAAFILGVLVTLAGAADLGIGITMLGVLAIPVAIGVAMLRYRLYEIDRVISRTLVYAALTVILGAAYAGLVIAGQAVFSSFAGGSNLAIAVSTLVVAALFLPLRARVQRVVDRRFYRRRYDAQRTLEAFGARLREEVDLAALAIELHLAVEETMQPKRVSLWLREGDVR